MLGRTETRTRDRMYCQTIGTVRDISPRRSSNNCDLQFANTDRFKDNYSIDVRILFGFLALPIHCFKEMVAKMNCSMDFQDIFSSPTLPWRINTMIYAICDRAHCNNLPVTNRKQSAV